MKKISIAEKIYSPDLYREGLDEIEEIKIKVDAILTEIIEDYSDELKKDNYKVRYGKKSHKFYLNWVGGNYDMSLESLIFCIILEEGFTKKMMPQKYLEDMKSQLKEEPCGIYYPFWVDNDNEKKDDKMNESVDFTIWYVIRGCIPTVGELFYEKGYDTEPFINASYLDEEEIIQKKKEKNNLKT